MLTFVTIVTLSMVNPSPSASTFAAVALFAANVDRQWPTDERGPAVTGEALRLMAVAARGIADDWKIEDGKLRESIAAFDRAREELFRHQRGDEKRPEVARDALDEGRVLIDRLAEALNHDDRTTRERSALKALVESFDDDKPVREQVDELEKYFQQAAAVLKSMLDAG
jgi:hypothetical protein